jgi:hypothetical protein
MRKVEVRFVKRSSNGKAKFKQGFFLKIEDEDIDFTFGLFLHNYASKILRSFNGVLDGFKENGNIKAFPMKFSAVRGKIVQVFDSENKNVIMRTILQNEELIFLLETIPSGDEGKFNRNYNYPLNHQHPKNFPKVGTAFYTPDMIDHDTDLKSQIFELRIESRCITDEERVDENESADFYFLKQDMEGISYGIFLLKYGKGILDFFRKFESSIPLFLNNGEFPMELKFTDALDMGERFDNFNRDEPLHWNRTYLNCLQLQYITPGDVEYFKEAVTDKAESSADCMVCFGGLYEQVIALDTDYDSSGTIKLPFIINRENRTKHDITTFPCGHKIHTHCFLKSCVHKFYKCLRCTRDPVDSWLFSEFNEIASSIGLCSDDARFKLFNCTEEIKNRTARMNSAYLDQYHDKGKSFADATRDARQDAIKPFIEEEIKLKLIHNILLDNINYINMKILPGRFIRSRFQQNTTPNPNGFQRLNLLLDRVI